MSLIDRTPERIWLRYSLGFPTSGADTGPVVIWVELDLGSHNKHFHLEPMRIRANDSVAEWYLAEDLPVTAQIWWRMQSSSPFASSQNLAVFKPIRLTLGEIARTPDQEQDQFEVDQLALTGGAFEVAIAQPNQQLRELLSMLWPTRSHADVIRLRCEPGGLHVEGRLPSSFFPGRNGDLPLPEAKRVVVLRLPRDRSDRTSETSTARPIWTLSSHPFANPTNPEIVYPNSISHVQKWADSLREFKLENSPDRTLLSLVDSVNAAPEESCEIRLLPAAGVGPARKIDWFAREMGLRVNLGGGSAAEATYLPEQLYGEAPLNHLKEWIVSFDSPVMGPASPNPNFPTVEITLTHPNAVERNVVAQLQPVAGPIVPIVAETGIRSDDKTATGNRMWLCTESGWAAIDSPGPLAEVDSEQDTPGPINGVLEVDRILAQLQPPSTVLSGGLSVQARTRLNGLVKLTLSGRSAQSPTQKWRSERLKFLAQDVFLTVVTPPVFYQPPQDISPNANSPSANPVLPTLATISLNTTDDNLIVSTLEQSLATERMQSAVFVSSNVTATKMNGNPASLTIQLLDTPAGFHLVIPNSSTTIWHRPERLPLVRSYPLNSDQNLAGFLDANRGLLPFRSQKPVQFRFSRNELPVLVPAPQSHSPQPDLLRVIDASGHVQIEQSWRLANSSGRGGSAAYFLPTIPGMEFDPVPAFLNSADVPEWVYRHGVPVLDEAYATTSETRRDPTSAAGSEPEQPDQGDLPFGFDPTRVSGTEAFRFGSSSSPRVANGWLPLTGDSDVSGGGLSINSLSASLIGRSPKLSIQIKNPNDSTTVDAEFSRTKCVAGLDGVRMRIGRPAAGGLATFTAKLAPGDDPSPLEYDDKIRNNGLPLLAAAVDDRIVTQDNLGLRHEEPADGRARFRQIGDSHHRVRLRESIHLLGEPLGSMVVDLAAFELTDDSMSPCELPRQVWFLHDGMGNFSTVGGFPFRPKRLWKFSENSEHKQFLSLEGSIELKEPRILPSHLSGDDAPLQILSGEISVTLTFGKAPDSRWDLTGFTGGLDWRFFASDSSRVEITRLTAEFSGETPHFGFWPLVVTSLELTSINGPLALRWTDSSVKAALVGGFFTMRTAAQESRSLFSARIEPFTLNRETFDSAALANDGSVPDWSDTGVAIEHALRWHRQEDGLDWSLVFAHGQDQLSDGWTLTVAKGDAFLINSGVQVHSSGPRKIVFLSNSPSAATLNLPDGSWFARRPNANDQVTGGAIFRAADELSALSVHVVLQLVPREGLKTLSGELVARLSVDANKQELIVSGWLELPNQLSLQAEGSFQLLNHTAKLLFRKARCPIDAVFFGKARSGIDNELVAAVEHQLSFKDRSVKWQVIQPIRFIRCDEFAKLYLSQPVSSDLANRLVIDLSWACWARIPQPQEFVGAGGGIDLSSPFLTTQWSLRLRAPARGQFNRQRAFVGRLPFGYAIPSILPEQKVLMGTKLSGNREVLMSGSPEGSTITALPPRVRVRTNARRTALMLHTPEVDVGGPNSKWLEPESLNDFFADSDRAVATASNPSQLVPPLLPAFSDALGNPVTKLPLQPATIPDWAWLLNELSQPGEVEFEIAAASLRTPYVPRSTPMPLVGSALVELPFQFVKAESPADQLETGTTTIETQLLTFVGSSFQVIRRARLEVQSDDTPEQRKQFARQWALEVLAETRRSEAAIVLVNFATGSVLRESDAESDPSPTAFIVPRPLTAVRTDRPTWSANPLSSGPDSIDQLPAYEVDPRCRLPRPVHVDANGNPLPITRHTRPVALNVDADKVSDVPEFVVFASRPEVPPPDRNARGIAATRHRLALTGPRQAGAIPSLSSARRASVVAVSHEDQSRHGELSSGVLFGLMKAEDVPFHVVQEGLFPSVGTSPHTSRESVLRSWIDSPTDSGAVVTIAPPQIDIVTWARRPGELSRSLIAGHKAGYPDIQSDNPSEQKRPYEDSPAIGQDITIRRSRAKSGPFEQVAIEPIRSERLLGGLFQYTRLRLTQTIDATSPPEPTGVYAVIGTKSEIGLSANTIADAEAVPTLLRANGTNFEQHSIFLVADRDFNPFANFASGNPMRRTVLLIRRGSSASPDGRPAPDLPPVAEGADWMVLLDEELVSPSHQDAEKPVWTRLAADGSLAGTYFMDPLGAVRKDRSDGVKQKYNELITSAVGAGQSLYVLLATYSRTEDRPEIGWIAPASPLLAIQIQFLNPRSDFEKPKSSVTLLQASKTSSTNSDTPVLPSDEDYRFSGYGRLGDDDFQPIQPVSFKLDGEAKPTRVGWARTVHLNSLDRLTRRQSPSSQSNDSSSDSPYLFDIVFYGPGGELVPTTFS